MIQEVRTELCETVNGRLDMLNGIATSLKKKKKSEQKKSLEGVSPETAQKIDFLQEMLREIVKHSGAEQKLMLRSSWVVLVGKEGREGREGATATF